MTELLSVSGLVIDIIGAVILAIPDLSSILGKFNRIPGSKISKLKNIEHKLETALAGIPVANLTEEETSILKSELDNAFDRLPDSSKRIHPERPTWELEFDEEFINRLPKINPEKLVFMKDDESGDFVLTPDIDPFGIDETIDRERPQPNLTLSRVPGTHQTLKIDLDELREDIGYDPEGLDERYKERIDTLSDATDVQKEESREVLPPPEKPEGEYSVEITPDVIPGKSLEVEYIYYELTGKIVELERMYRISGLSLLVIGFSLQILATMIN
ncbi:hypothetical protein [Natrinema versiforme]|uniref:hypothetical protein n=1 Tax=Natrinema versiforme TaxID=88724 RepID=UPI001268DE56|nr:hypothetical protein [Natrinema versiforme]